MAKLETFKLTNKAEALKSLGAPIKLLKTLLHATDNIIYLEQFYDRQINKCTTIYTATIRVV